MTKINLSVKRRELEKKLLDQQEKKAEKIIRSAEFLESIKKIRQEFVKQGFPAGGFSRVTQKDKWFDHLKTEDRTYLERRLKIFIYNRLINMNCSDKWVDFIKYFLYYNKAIDPPTRNCDFSTSFSYENEFYHFCISGSSFIPSITELELLRTELEINRECTMKRSYSKRINIIRHEIKRKQNLGLSFKEIKSGLKNKFGIEVSVDALKKHSERSESDKKRQN